MAEEKATCSNCKVVNRAVMPHTVIELCPLHAAAPDLLEAARAALVVLYQSPYQDDYVLRTTSELESAIKKAGE